MAAAGQPAMRAAASSGRWQQEQTLVTWAPRGPRSREADRASGCASNVREPHLDLLCVLVATAQNPQYQQTTERAMSRACSWMSTRDLACRLLWAALRFEFGTAIAVELAGAINRSVLPSCTNVPLQSRAAFRPCNGRRRWIGSYRKSRSARLRAIISASICRTREYVARYSSPPPASSASEPHRGNAQYPRQAAPA